MCKGAVVAVIVAENGVDCKSLEETGYVDNVLDKLVISGSKLVYSCLYVLNMLEFVVLAEFDVESVKGHILGERAVAVAAEAAPASAVAVAFGSLVEH